MTYAIDTNIIILYTKNLPNIIQKFDSIVSQGADIVIPKMVDYEMRRGFRIQSVPKIERLYNEMSNTPNCFCKIIGLDNNCWERAERIYSELYQKRFTVGEMDILIAAICLENSYVLITNNEKDFKNINGLIIENWII